MAAFQICYSKLLGFDFDALISYDTFFTFVGAVGLFMYFRELSFSSNMINQLAKPCLAVYVIHLNPLIFHYIFDDILHTKAYSGYSYVTFLLVAPPVIYLACAVIELCRNKATSLFVK